jgi:hypothetical protein
VASDYGIADLERADVTNFSIRELVSLPRRMTITNEHFRADGRVESVQISGSRAR